MKNLLHSFCAILVLALLGSVFASTYPSVNKSTGHSIAKTTATGLSKSAASDTIMNVQDFMYDGSDSLAEVFTYRYDQKLRPFARTGYTMFDRFEYDKRDMPVVTCIVGGTLLEWFTTAYDTQSHWLTRDTYHYCPTSTYGSNPAYSSFMYDSLTGRIAREDVCDGIGWVMYSLTYSYDRFGRLVKVYAPGVVRTELVYGPVPKPAPVTVATMQGDWRTGSMDYGCSTIRLEGYSSDYTFVGDSFFCRRYCFTDAINPSDTCSTTFEWTLYIRGAFSINQDSIVFIGLYTDSNFVIRTGGCAYGPRQWGTWNQTYLYQLSGTTMILFDHSFGYLPEPTPVIWMNKTVSTASRPAALSSPRPAAARIIETAYYTASGRRLSLTPAQLRSHPGIVITAQRLADGKVEVKRGFGKFR
ncbi:MAG TPA: hypothetical protein VLX68_08925 [Chitinivibrionales bacterium]|nr:hypothetical protein [Chitinivibrionales bacterium]